MTDIVPTDEHAAPLGLEDIDESSLAMPRLTIVGEEAVFQDSLSNEKYSVLDTVVLGLVQQRVLFPPEMSETSRNPLCRSRDGKIGLPQEGFPWDASGFEPIPGLGDEQQELSCAACPLKEWGSHPKRDQVPWCNEQWVAVLYHEGGPGLLTIQRSGIAAVRAFATGFIRTQMPTFTKYTSISLTPLKRGSVKYAVPVFTTGDKTPEEDHAFYADVYTKTRAFLQSTRARAAATDNGDIAQAAVKAPRQPAPVDESDDPF